MAERPAAWHTRLILLVVFGFFVATGLTQWKMIAVDRAASQVSEDAAPSIEQLTTARNEIRTLQLLLRERYDLGLGKSDGNVRAIQESRRRMNKAFDEYLGLPILPGERELWDHILEVRTAFDGSLERFESELDRGDREAAGVTLSAFAAEADALNVAITRDVEFNASLTRARTREIRELRRTSMLTAIGADLLCALLAALGAVLVHRVTRAHAALVAERNRINEERASELDMFAGRVAHDILSPLNAVSLAFDLACQPTASEEQRAGYKKRGVAALGRVKRLVDGLLTFARAGAKPTPGACADVRSTMSDLAQELQPAAAEAGAILTIEPAADAVACDPGVLTSLVSNLVRNAIKYIGAGPTRRIDVRAFDRGDFVHVEVDDTGPGLSPDVEDRVFEPYARSRAATQPGIGLGLATVKRLTEGHGGQVGVSSTPGKGCRFWFELPKCRRAVGRDRVPSLVEHDG